MQNTLLRSHYSQNFQKSNFNVFRYENLFDNESYEAVVKNHKVGFYTLMFITEGSGKHSIDFTDFTFSKGTILSIRKDQLHKFYFNDKAKGFLLCFKEEFLNHYLNEEEVRNSIQMFNHLLTSPKTQIKEQDFIGVYQLAAGVESEHLTISDKYSLKIIRSMVHILITLIYRIKSEGHNKVQLNKYVKEFIRFQNILEQDYFKTKKVFDYANKLGYSTKKLNTIVKFVTDKPAKEFIDDTVVVKVKSLLIHSNSSVKEIAYKVGFNDSTNFYKYFKKFTNYTPEEFRKNYKS